MNYTLNTTDNYHINDLNSLGWEMTVCNSLYPERSPCRKALHVNRSFGVLLFHYLKDFFPMNKDLKVLEVGGGLGNLMHDFLSLNPRLRPTMLDISPFLLKKQEELLQNFAVEFMQTDILQIDTSVLLPFDMVIMNENLGDLPVLVADTEANNLSDDLLVFLQRADYFSNKYRLPKGINENICIGALEVMEKLCRAGIKYIYMSEHSCEAIAPDKLKPYLYFNTPGNPEKISLKGHSEYTIKFSFLQRIAESFDYKVTRGNFTDFLKPDFNDRVNSSLRASVPCSAEQEILQQFIYDLYKYEYLVLVKGGKDEDEY